MRKDFLIFLFALGVLLFSWPVLAIFKANLAVYLAVLWACYIALVYIVSRHGDSGAGFGEDRGRKTQGK